MIKHNLFPTLVLQDHYVGNADEMLNSVEQQEKLEHPFFKGHTYTGHIDKKEKVFKLLEADVLNTAYKWIQYCGYDTETKLVVSDMWYNLYDGMTGLQAHNHPNSYLAGVYYLTEDNNPLVLIDPSNIVKTQTLLKVSDRKKYMQYCSEHIIKPNKGDMIIFPAWLYHNVQPITEAINIGFNVTISGPYGDKVLNTYNENV